jgi:molecular chaperone DnaK
MGESIAVGIDLGTSNSCVATVIDGRPRVMANAYGERTTASVVAFGEDGGITVGNQAKARVILDPRHTVSSAKRLMGRYFFSEEVRKARAISQYQIVPGPANSVRIKIRSEDFSLPEISAFVLKEMKRIAEQSLGQPVTRAVITVPAYFNDNQRQATKDAGKIAGLDVLRILNEPTAAALAYGYNRNLRQRVAVYDLGGGTFDVSILEIGKDVFEVLSTCGDTFLGGDDFDDRIIDLLAEDFQTRHGVNARRDPFACEKLKAAAEKAKMDLSQSDTVQVRIPALATVDGQSLSLEREVTRAEFEKLVADLIQRTFKVCDEALQQASLTIRDLDGVILVGGPTRLPTIREAASTYFGREAEQSIDPDEVVALGAAIHASSLIAENANTYLLDVTPLSLRIGIAGGMAEPVIERNTPVPIETTRIFTTVRDFQDAVAVRIYQGESRSASENELLGEFEFSGFNAAPRGQVQIEVTFSISTEGIVDVSARDPVSGAERSTSVKLSSGLTEAEIAEIIARGRTNDVATAQRVGRDPKPARKAAPAPATDALELPDSDADDELVLEPLHPARGEAATPPPAEDSQSDELFGSIDEIAQEPESGED